MTRTRASAKDAGARFERGIADFLAFRLKDDRIDRRVRTGKDRGDLAGLRTALGERIVAECKNYGGRILPGPWLLEAQTEADNDDAPVAIVIAKRRGTTDPSEQIVLMTMRDLVILMGGENYDR
jgi:hypothetical protein